MVDEAKNRVVRLSKVGEKLKVIEEAVPAIAAGGAVVRILAFGVSTAAKVLFEGKAHLPPPAPFIPGPNGVGVIESVAEDVVGLAKGDMVLLASLLRSDHNNPALPQSQILVGWFPLGAAPDTMRLAKLWKNGCWGQRVLLPAQCLHVVPAIGANSTTLNFAELLLVPGFCIAHGALNRSGLREGESVVVNGATGSLGAQTVLLALAMGASKVWAVGRNRDRLDLLAKIAPKRVVPVPVEVKVTEDQVTKVSGATAHVLIDFLGYVDTPDSTMAAIRALRPRGRAVFCGGVRANIAIDYSYVLVCEISITGSFMYPKSSVQTVLNLLNSGAVDLSLYKHKEFEGLDRINDIVKEASDQSHPFHPVCVYPSGKPNLKAEDQ